MYFIKTPYFLFFIIKKKQSRRRKETEYYVSFSFIIRNMSKKALDIGD